MGISVYLRGITSFTEQGTAFTRAQSILQSRDSNFFVQRALKIPYPLCYDLSTMKVQCRVTLKEQCHEDVAVLGQLCVKLLL